MALSHGTHAVASPARPRLFRRLRQALHSRHYGRRPERTCGQWVRRFIFFHNAHHPAEMDEAETALQPRRAMGHCEADWWRWTDRSERRWADVERLQFETGGTHADQGNPR